MSFEKTESTQKKPNEAPEFLWPPSRVRKRRQREIENMPISIQTDLHPSAAARKLRRGMLHGYYDRRTYRLWHDGKTLIGEVSKWIESNWIDEGYTFYIRRYRFLYQLFPSLELKGVIIPTESGSQIKAKVSYAPFRPYRATFTGLAIIFTAFLIGFVDLEFLSIFVGLFLPIVFFLFVSITRSLLDIELLKNVIPERFVR